MDFYEVIEKRRTVRDFEEEEIADAVIERIISAALKAPTNDHMRDWHYIVVRDRETVVKLLDAIPKGISDEDMDKLVRDWNLDDSLKQKTDILHPDNISHLNGFASIWCSIENLFLAAVAEGYGCNLRIPLGDESEYARKVLGYPDDYYMPCFIGIGKPKDNAPMPKQKDINVKDRIHWDRF